MAESKKLLIKAAILLIVAICVMSVGVLSVFGHTPDSKKTVEGYISNINTVYGEEPTLQEMHEKRFGAYTHLRELNGKKIATVYSSEQITQIQNERNEGKWMYLTDAEVLYLISDTVSLFQGYDTVCIVGLDGAVSVYDTLHYSKKSLYDAVSRRLEVLCSSFYCTERGEYSTYLIMNESTVYSGDAYMSEVYGLINGFYFGKAMYDDGLYKYYKARLKSKTQGSAFVIRPDGVYYVNELSQAVKGDMICVL